MKKSRKLFASLFLVLISILVLFLSGKNESDPENVTIQAEIESLNVTELAFDSVVPELAFSPLPQNWHKVKDTRYDSEGTVINSWTYSLDEDKRLYSSEDTNANLGVRPDQDLNTFGIWTVDAQYNESGQMIERVRTRPLYDGRTSIETDLYYYDNSGNISVWLHYNSTDDGTVEELSVYSIGAYDSGTACHLYEFQLITDNEGYLEYAVCNLGYYAIYKFDHAGRVLWVAVLNQDGSLDGYYISEFESIA